MAIDAPHYIRNGKLTWNKIRLGSPNPPELRIKRPDISFKQVPANAAANAGKNDQKIRSYIPKLGKKLGVLVSMAFSRLPTMQNIEFWLSAKRFSSNFK